MVRNSSHINCSTLVRRSLFILRFEHPKFRCLTRTSWDRQIQSVALFIPVTGARTDGTGDSGDLNIMVGVLLLEDADEPFTTGNVDALSSCIEVKVIHVASAGHVCHDLSGRHVQDN